MMCSYPVLDGALATSSPTETQEAQFVCPQDRQMYLVETRLNQHQVRRLMMGEQTAQPFSCPCGAVHWFSIVYPPTFVKLQALCSQPNAIVVWDQ